MNSLEFGFNSFWHILSLGPKPKQHKCLGWTIRNKDQNVWMSDMGKLFFFFCRVYFELFQQSRLSISLRLLLIVI